MSLQALDFFVLRTPLFSYDTKANLSEEKLKEFYKQPLAQEALFLASYSLYNKTIQWLNNDAAYKATDKEHKKLLTSLAKYLLRMAYRCTPFGLFAGISLGSFSNHSHLILPPVDQYIRRSRFDMAYLCALGLNIAQDPQIRNQLVYYPNQTLYETGDYLRYVEYRIAEKERTHHLVNIDHSEYIQQVLDKAKQGAKPISLAAVLVNDEITFEEALGFIYEMINAQVLVSELEPKVTGKAFYIHQLTEHLQKIDAGETLAEHLSTLNQALDNISQTSFGEGIRHYQQITKDLEALKTPGEPGQLFQVDLLKPAQNIHINTHITQEVKQVIDLLTNVQPYEEQENLRKFKEAFYQKYEDREVPLTEVLDTEAGIGYPANNQGQHNIPKLLDKVYVGVANDPPKHSWGKWQTFLLNKYSETLANQASQIEISSEEAAEFIKKDGSRLSSSLYSFVNVLASSPEAVDNGDFQLGFQMAAGPSSANLLGRFCYLDSHLQQKVKEALTKEEQEYPEAIFAEIVHLPEARLGNISFRPVLRNYEIALMASSSVDEDHTILLSDLMVSLMDEEVVLRSQKLNKQVIPRLSTAHNYSNNPIPAYHFLCDLQLQGVQESVFWDWGTLNNANWLPRVCYGKSILTAARWILTPKELGTEKKKDESKLIANIQEICEKRSIPRHITISEGDNTLPIDLENPLSRQVLVDIISPQKNLVLTEDLFREDNLLLSEEGTDKKYTSELVVPLQYESQKPTQAHWSLLEPDLDIASAKVQRSFMPGSEWTYLKIYCGFKTADKILTEVISEFGEQLLEEEIIDQWFFIRYTDPAHHLRVRFHKSSLQTATTFNARVLTFLHSALEPFMQTGEIANVQLDTYHRELERYEPLNIVDSEKLFFYDSKNTTHILALLDDGEIGEQLRWQLALRGIDTLLQDFGYDYAARKRLVEMLKNSFIEEFQMNNKFGKKMLGNKFRKLRPQIDQILKPEFDSSDELFPALQAYNNRSQEWQPVVQSILKRYASRPFQALDDLLGSYIHMFLNRFLQSKQREQEMVLYDMLYQYYRSVIAKEKHLAKVV